MSARRPDYGSCPNQMKLSRRGMYIKYNRSTISVPFPLNVAERCEYYERAQPAIFAFVTYRINNRIRKSRD